MQPIPVGCPGLLVCALRPSSPQNHSAAQAAALVFPEHVEQSLLLINLTPEGRVPFLQHFCGRFEMKKEKHGNHFYLMLSPCLVNPEEPMPLGAGSRAVPSLPTRGFPALFYLLSSISHTLCQTVTHSNKACAEAICLSAGWIWELQVPHRRINCVY